MKMSLRKVWNSRCFLAVVAVVMFTSALMGQDRPPSRVDIFTGYSWLHPGYNTLVPNAQENIARGYTVSSTFFFNRHVGLSVDTADHLGCCCPTILTITGGPTVRFPMEHATVFFHALGGLHRMALLAPFGVDNSIGVIAGGGLDVPVLRHVSLRLAQVDYEWANHSYGVLQPTLNGVRLSAGIVWQLGSVGPPAAAAAASCSVQPTEVFAGEPLTATASGSNFNPKRDILYRWSGDGVKDTGNQSSVQVSTAGLAPGTYHLSANLSDGSKRGAASCDAAFSVKEPPPPPARLNPPTVSCNSNPGTVKSGEPSSITAMGQSPDNRPLTYSFTSTSGRVNGNASRATLDTAGASVGSITVSCTATDDRGLSATSQTSVNIEVPPPPPMASKCGSIEFSRDKRRPARVDNEAKAILDDCALRLQQDSGAQAVIVGNSDANEKNGAGLARQRAINTKDYLVTDKGITPTRLEVRTGNGGTQSVDIWVVPAGATFAGDGTQTFDETRSKAQPRNRR
jgi:outer membrane protein OmpA-like peptidoglycan-associated protein